MLSRFYRLTFWKIKRNENIKSTLLFDNNTAGAVPLIEVSRHEEDDLVFHPDILHSRSVCPLLPEHPPRVLIPHRHTPGGASEGDHYAAQLTTLRRSLLYAEPDGHF